MGLAYNMLFIENEDSEERYQPQFFVISETVLTFNITMKSKKKRGSRFFSAMSTFFTNTASDTLESKQEPSQPKSSLQKKPGICSALIEVSCNNNSSNQLSLNKL